MPIGPDPAFFRLVDERYVGFETARGPWDENACHGGPVTGTIAREVERRIPDKQLVRLTLNFLRPIPLDGYRISVEVEKAGRAVATASASLTGNDGRVCASAAALLLTAHDYSGLPSPRPSPPEFEASTPGFFVSDKSPHGKPFFNSGIEIRYPPGETNAPGPTTMWMQSLPIVEGEEPSPFQRLCPLADCGNGISRNGDFDVASFINPDLTVVVHRLPASDWLASESISFWQDSGIGMSHSILHDTQGPVGAALQALIITPVNKR